MSSRRYLRRRHITWLSIALALFILIGQYYGWFSYVANKLDPVQPGYYRVVKYVDGDTIMVDMNGSDETIRFIGVDTPETHKPNTPVQCGGPEASAYTKKTIGAYNQVRLQSDPLSSNRDRYDRLLRYIYLPNGVLMNENLIQNGYGFAYTYFPFTRAAQFTKDEKAAITSHKGLWSYCRPTPNQYGGYNSNIQ